MNNKQASSLTEKQYLLLSRYVDEDLGFFAKRKAEKLIDASSEARSWCENLKVSSKSLGSLDQALPKVSLWENVSLRIEQEERANFYLGDRKEVKGAKGSKAGFQLGWGLAGTFAAACLALLMFNPQFQTDGVSSFQTADSNVSLGSTDSSTLPVAKRSLSTIKTVASKGNFSQQSTVEVDWIKSAGRVRMINRKDRRKTPMIWIQRKAPQVETEFVEKNDFTPESIAVKK